MSPKRPDNIAAPDSLGSYGADDLAKDLGSALPPVSPPESVLNLAVKRLTDAAMACYGLPNRWEEMLDDVIDAARADLLDKHYRALAALRDGPPGEPTSKALMAAQNVLSGGRIGFDVRIHLTTKLVEDALRAAYAIDGRGTATS